MKIYKNFYEKFMDEAKEDLKIIHSIQETMEVEILNEYFKVSNKYLKANINVYGDGKEGPYPHFHVIFEGHESCFCIFEPMYANHEAYHVKMEYNKLLGLNTFLMSPCKILPNPKANYWSLIVDLWVKANKDNKWIHKDDYIELSKPNYTLCKDCVKMGNKYNHDTAKTY